MDTVVTELGIKVDSTSNLIQQQEAVIDDLKVKQEEDSKIYDQYKVQTEEIKNQLTSKIKEFNEEVETLEKEIQNLETNTNSYNKIERNDGALKSNARLEELVTRDLVEATSTIFNYKIEVKELMVSNKELKIQIIELEKDDDQTTRTVIQLLISAVIIAFHFYLTKAVN